MKYIIKKQNDKYYLLRQDDLGNLYETFTHATTKAKINLYKIKFEIEDKLGFCANCTDLYKQLDICNDKLARIK